jgi:hypothetical protein
VFAHHDAAGDASPTACDGDSDINRHPANLILQRGIPIHMKLSPLAPHNLFTGIGAAAAAVVLTTSGFGWAGATAPASHPATAHYNAATASAVTALQAAPDMMLAACQCHPSEGGVADGLCRGCDGFGDTVKQGGTDDSTCGSCSGSGDCQKCLGEESPGETAEANAAETTVLEEGDELGEE